MKMQTASEIDKRKCERRKFVIFKIANHKVRPN